MATTTSSLNDGFTSNIAVQIPALDVTKFALVDTKVLDDGASRESVYQYMGGTEEYPLSIRVGVYKNAKANGGVGSTNVSIKIASFAQKADLDDVIWTHPETWTLAKSAPGGNPFYDVAADKEMIGSLFSMIFNINAGALDTGNVDELKFGVTNRILQHGNTAA